jgi:hypothetical protein
MTQTEISKNIQRINVLTAEIKSIRSDLSKQRRAAKEVK